MAQRGAQFAIRYLSFEPIFYSLVNSDSNLFQEGLLFYIQLTLTLM